MWKQSLGVTPLLLAGSLVLWGCEGPKGDPGERGESSGTVSGTVLNAIDEAPIEGLDVGSSPSVTGVTLTTNATGAFSATLPVGNYTLTFADSRFRTATRTVSVLAGQETIVDVRLMPAAGAVVSAASADGAYDADVTLHATVDIFDGSTVSSVAWTKLSGPDVTFVSGADTTDPVVKMPSREAQKEYLWQHLELPDRLGIVATNFHALEAAEAVTLQVTVTTTKGTAPATVTTKYKNTATVHLPAPIGITTGLLNVPIDEAVFFRAPATETTVVWTVTGPDSAAVDLGADASSRNLIFAPTTKGKYTISLNGGADGKTLEMYAGTYMGVISGADANGRPVFACTGGCHAADSAQVAGWAKSGHADIFSVNLATSNHYTEDCFSCHTVGFNPDADNGGIDEAANYAAFMASSVFETHVEGGHDVTVGAMNPAAWAITVGDFPDVARLGNIQCENCHGPQDSAAHALDADPRVSLGSDLCGTCHGEPLRHGRFQQWQESGHANFELAIDEAAVEQNAPGNSAGAASCGRCHSAQGFLVWIEQDDLGKCLDGSPAGISCSPPFNNLTDLLNDLKELGLNEQEVQPITCAVCHDPHNAGTQSGEPNKVVLRVTGSTPTLPAGFAATGVGEGALCIMCHNTRNGAHNDTTSAHLSGSDLSFSAPHVSAQGDTLMGQNAYFVTVGDRSPHSYIANTCVNCHMVKTPPPKELSYNLSGTNHSFAASTAVCLECHAGLDGASFEATGEEELESLAAVIGDALKGRINSLQSSGSLCVRAWNPATGGYSSGTGSPSNVAFAASAAGVELEEIQGQMSVKVTLSSTIPDPFGTNGATTTELWFQLRSLKTDDNGCTTAGGTIALALDDLNPDDVILVKALWNYFLLHSDGSHGVHNPGFFEEVIAATKNQL